VCITCVVIRVDEERAVLVELVELWLRGGAVEDEMDGYPADPVWAVKRRNGSMCNIRSYCMFLVPHYLVGEGLSWYL